MLYSEWVHPDYKVKIEYMSELKQMVDSQGYIRRAFGISSGIFELLSYINPDTLIQELEECAILAETSALGTLDIFTAYEEYEEYAHYDMEAYYLSCELGVEFDDGVEHECLTRTFGTKHPLRNFFTNDILVMDSGVVAK